MIERVESAIRAISPTWALRRARANMVLSMFGGGESSYAGASTTRRALSDWIPKPKSADDDMGRGRPLLRARSRSMFGSDPIATAALRTLASKVIGSRGLQLQAKLDWERAGLKSEAEAADWRGNAEAEWRFYSETPECDITRTQTFCALQGLAWLSTLLSGDCFALLPMVERPGSVYWTRIQVIEADLVATPKSLLMDANRKIVEGVEMDRYGAPIAYHVLNAYPGTAAYGKDDGARRIEAFNARGRRQMIHMLDRDRPGQTRGIPCLTPVIEPLKQLSKYTEAELMAAVVNAILTLFITTEGEGLPNETGATKRNGDNFKLGSGTVLEGLPGDKVEVIAANRPSGGFDPFVKSVSQQVGAALGMPSEVLMKHFASSYSAARAALLEAWHFVRNRRQFVIDTFCRPIYEAWMEEAIALDRISAPGFFDDPAVRAAYLQAEWMGDPPGQINPVDDASAAKIHLELGTTTREDEIFKYSGKVLEDVHEQQVKEKQMRESAGLAPAPGSAPADPPADDPDNRDKKREDEDAA